MISRIGFVLLLAIMAQIGGPAAAQGPDDYAYDTWRHMCLRLGYAEPTADCLRILLGPAADNFELPAPGAVVVGSPDSTNASRQGSGRASRTAPRSTDYADRLWRIEALLGYNIGTFRGELDFNVGGTNVLAETDSFVFGGTGLSAAIGVWRDQVKWPGLSLGLQYYYLHNALDATLTTRTNVGGVLGAAAEIDADASLDAHLGFINAAYRTQRYRPVYPYVGGGLGIGHGALDVDFSGNARVSGQLINRLAATENELTEDSIIGGFQVFGGVDFELGDGWLWGAGARFIIAPGELVDFPITYSMFTVYSNMSYSF